MVRRFIFPGIVAFQVTTLALYYFGPIEYLSTGVPSSAAVYVIFYLAMLVAGYALGGRYYFRGRSGPSDPIGFVKFSALVTLLLFPFALMGKVGDVSSAANLGDLYGLSAIRKSESDTLVDYFRIVIGCFLFGLFPVLVWFGRKMPKKIAVLGWLAISTNLAMTLLVGVNKVIFDYIILFAMLAAFKGRSSDLLTKKGVAIGVAGIFAVVLAAAFFVEGQMTRYGSSAVSGENPRLGAYSAYAADDGELKVLYSAMTGYLSQGYRAFDLALNKPFEFTWGVGNSTFFSRQVDRIFGTELGDGAYPARIEADGWDRYNDWSTFYVWWASDLSFYGVAILMLLIGLFFRAIENTVVVQGDLAAIILYSYMIILLIYLSANNQVFQSGEMAVGYLSLFLPLLVKRKFVRRSSGCP